MEETPELTPQIEATEDLTDEVDEVAEALAAHDIISEERHEQIITEVTECRNRLEVLSTQERAESPLLSRIQAEVMRLNLALTEILSSLTDLKTQSNRTPSVSVPESPTEPVLVESTAEPVQDAPQETQEPEAPPTPVTPKRKRFRVI